MKPSTLPPGFKDMLSFRLIDGLLGRRSRRFFMGAEMPDGVFNKPSTLVVIPVGDLSQHTLLNICYMLQNGLVLYDDINRTSIPGVEQFKDIVGVENVWPITFVEQWGLSELTVELGASCYAGILMLQAMGLGGWMFNGVDPFAMLGASGDPKIPGRLEGFPYTSGRRRVNVVPLPNWVLNVSSPLCSWTIF